MEVWGVTNQKGGVGKTTVTVCLAGALAELGRRVLVIDADSVVGAGSWLLPTPPAGEHEGTAAVLFHRAPIASVAIGTSIAGIDCVPGSPVLALAPKRLARAPDAESRLQQAVAGLPRGRWNWVLIDSGPTLELLTLNVLGAARRLLVPIEPDYMSAQGLAALAARVDTCRQGFNPRLEIGAVVVNKYRRSRLADEIEAAVRARFGRTVLRTRIRATVRVCESPSWHLPITTYKPKHPVADDFRALARELLKRGGKR